MGSGVTSRWQTSRFDIDLTMPKVMGIVNVTPDSFSDGGAHATSNAACAHCDLLLRDGADILDIGGESTRPGAASVALQEELARVLPVVRYAVTLGVPVSVDTYKPAVMQAVLDLGADIINDIWALRWSDGAATTAALSAEQVVAAHKHCGVCLMHMHRDPQTMQMAPMEGDPLPAVARFLQARAQALRDRGVASGRICLDPGIGFGKTPAQNFALLARQEELLECGYPLLAGWSRKSSLATVLQREEQGSQVDMTDKTVMADMSDRLAPSLAAALLAVQRGASVVRVHDVRQTVQVLAVLEAVKRAGN